MGVRDQSYFGGHSIFCPNRKLNILQVTKKFCRTYQKNFPDIPKNLPVNIKKFSLTSRNFRNYTKKFSLHIIFFWNFNVLSECRIDFCPTAEIWGTCPPPPANTPMFILALQLIKTWKYFFLLFFILQMMDYQHMGSFSLLLVVSQYSCVL